MEPALLPPLAAWTNFYVIVGSSAAALTGLQFVVIALGAEARSTRGEAVSAFGTPTIVHFCAALSVSAILNAPWPALASAGLALGACGAAGIAYMLIVIRRVRGHTGYEPVLEDWLWHGVLPFLAYAALLTAALCLTRDSAPCLFGVAATTLLLLFVGIHNAWDAVTYIAVLNAKPSGDAGARPPARRRSRPAGRTRGAGRV